MILAGANDVPVLHFWLNNKFVEIFCSCCNVVRPRSLRLMIVGRNGVCLCSECIPRLIRCPRGHQCLISCYCRKWCIPKMSIGILCIRVFSYLGHNFPVISHFNLLGDVGLDFRTGKKYIFYYDFPPEENLCNVDTSKGVAGSNFNMNGRRAYATIRDK